MVYTSIIRIPIKGGMTIPNTRSLDPGSYGYFLRGSKPRKQLRADYALRLERSDGMERELSIDMEEDGESYPRCSMGLEYLPTGTIDLGQF